MCKPLPALAYALVLIPPAPCPQAQEADGLEQAVEDIAVRALASGVDGLSVAVAMGDELVVADGWGQADDDEAARADSSYHVGALSEAFLACAVLQMVEEGELALGDALVVLLPELGASGAESERDGERSERRGAAEAAAAGATPSGLERITLAHLLTHTSGLPSYEDFLVARGATTIEPEEVLRWLAGMPLDFEPGACQQFSDTNTWLLGTIVERETGLGVPQLLGARVFERAGMESTGYRDARTIHEVDSDVHEFGGAEILHARRPRPFDGDRLCASAGDLVRWMRALVQHELVGEASFEALVTPPAVERGGSGGRGHGLDVTKLEDEPCYSAGGGAVGYRAHVAYHPGLDMTIVVLAHGDDAPARSIARSIARAAFGLAEPGVQDLPFSQADSRPYAGDYMVGCNMYRVAFTESRLTLHTPDQRAIALASQGRHAFLARSDPSLSLTFEVDDDGSARSFTLVENGVESFARRMR